ncbi:hypothetical protein, partial [Mycobacterium asiaticum]|uniref:hypothetical protein n=1 Tax=Mycobacterium asiaticum TaxID=1790 RepID=UPI000AEBCB54
WQTFNRWVRERHLKPIRYVRAAGKHRHAPWRRSAEDIPEYRVGDVRQVNRRMAEQNPVKARTS